jgi:hypothetical protein
MSIIWNKQDFSDLADLAAKVKSDTYEVNQELSGETVVKDSGGDTTNSVMEVETIPQKDNPVSMEELKENVQETIEEKNYDFIQYKERIDNAIKFVIWAENKLPIFENLYLLTSGYVDKINLAFADLLKNVLHFEDMKNKILQQTKDFKVRLAIKEEDKKSLKKEMDGILEGYKYEVAQAIEHGEEHLKEKQEAFEAMLTDWEQEISKAIDKKLQEIKEANNNIIQKVEVNASFIDNINRIKKEYLLAFFAFLISGTILMTIIVTYLLQMK